ncbi:hypothetical protein GGR57DRAFT_517974 [Xylariaceae sp. FL1272]|nr:hypothetical protein GGR57DRAFT_517974 [Xylariaceae sp. FL1272]
MAYSLTIELFTELAFGVVLFAVRFYARWRLATFRGFGLDDFFAGVALIFWILEATFLYTCGALGNNIGLTAETAAAIPDSEVPRLVEGSKQAYAAWIFYILVIWAMKAVLLCICYRLTIGLWQQKLANVMTVLSCLTFLASLFWHIFSCFPTSRSWQIKPFPGDECTTRRGNYIVITVLDIITDLGIMAIPLPMLIQTSLSLRRKISLCILFSSGIFVMIAAIIRAYYSLANIENLTVALGWASREILVASIVVCAPAIKPLVTDARKKLTGHSGTGTGSWKTRDASNGGHLRLGDTASRAAENKTTITASGNQKRAPTYMLSNLGRSQSQGESQDHITTVLDTDDNSIGSSGAKESGIVVTTRFEVSRQ